MQYIQLQGQVAADLDLPIAGGYNLFIDTSDNSIKAKDSDGHMHGGGGLSLTEVTREALDELISSASLTPGAFYKITGVASRSFYEDREWSYTGMGNEIQDGGTTIILQAATDKTLSKKGIGLFYVPNYENPEVPTAQPDNNYLVWDNTSRFEFNPGNLSGYFDHDERVRITSAYSSSYASLQANTGYDSLTLTMPDDSTFFSNPDNYPFIMSGSDTLTQLEITRSLETASYNSGDCVIWGGRVWQNLSGSVGYATGGWPLAQLQLNEEDWTVVPFNETNYTIVADLIEYEFEWDNISYRKSANNVEVRCDGRLMLDYWGYNMIKYFPWGHYGTQNISINNSYLDAFVNYPHDAQAHQIKFADYGGFNAHYWGRGTGIYNITGDINAHMVSLNLGYQTEIRDITLGSDARISDIYTYDNDNGWYIALQNIVLGTDAYIDGDWDPIYLYSRSYMSGLILENNSYITDINLYTDSSIRDTKLGINSYIASIGLNDSADFRQVELGNSSHISYINADVSACFKRVKTGIDSYIEYMWIGINGYFKHIEIADESNINCIGIGDYSYFRYVNLGIRSSIYAIDQTPGNSYFEYINVGIESSIGDIELGSYSYFTNINTGINSGIYSIYQRETFLAETTASYTIPSTGSICNNINVGINSSIHSIEMGSNSTLNNFEIANEGGISSLILSQSVSLERFKIGQDFGFSSSSFSSSLSDVVIDYGFNNFGAGNNYYGFVDFGNVIDSTNYMESASLLSSHNNIQSVYAINANTTDFSTYTLNYYLPNGQYEGQTVELVLIGDSNNLYDGNVNKIKVWMQSLRLTGGVLADKAGYIGTNTFWFPFMKGAAIGEFSVLRETNPKAIWIQGAWTIDNGCWQD
jgi:hypothetical protein